MIKEANKGTIKLAYAQQDDQIVSTNVIAQVLEEQGYKVDTTSSIYQLHGKLFLKVKLML